MYGNFSESDPYSRTQKSDSQLRNICGATWKKSCAVTEKLVICEVQEIDRERERELECDCGNRYFREIDDSMPRPNKRVKRAHLMVAARRSNRGVHDSENTEFIGHQGDTNAEPAIEEADEWFRDLDVVNQISVPELHWKDGAKPGTRKHHNGFGRSSTFTRKAQMKKMQVRMILNAKPEFVYTLTATDEWMPYS